MGTAASSLQRDQIQKNAGYQKAGGGRPHRTLTTTVGETVVDEPHFIRLRPCLQQDFDIVRLGVVETSKRRLSKQSDTGGLVSSVFNCFR